MSSTMWLVPGQRTAQVLDAVTLTILTESATPQAGHRHPAVDTVSKYQLASTATTK